MTTPSSLDLHIKELLDQTQHQFERGGSAHERLDRIVDLLHTRVPHYTWVGIYLLKDDELFLGPFRGKPSPHTRIPLNRGICGAAASQQQTVIVPDVNADDRYLACSIETKSEIVVPVMDGSVCLGEIDIDSDIPDAFSAPDQTLLEGVADRVAPLLKELIPSLHATA
jgi:putative methionine-R-sulfoxide reductase with GAF domain